jgi:acid phosphatase
MLHASIGGASGALGDSSSQSSILKQPRSAATGGGQASPDVSPTAAPARSHSPTAIAVGSHPGSKTPAAVAAPPHVLLLIEENKNAGVPSGSPYLHGLATAYASSSRWFGVDHPSAPNYVALTSGSTQTVVGDCTPPSCGPYPGPSLGGQLTAAGIPWAAYMESMPAPCYSGPNAGEYAEKHDPFMYFDDVLHNGCAEHVLPYPGVNALVSTLDSPNAPDFVWITPNLLHDMHDGSVAQGDAWAQANLAPILASSWFTHYDSTVIVTMDEGDNDASASCCGQPPGGPVPLIVVSSADTGIGSIPLNGDQYGTLRAIEQEFGLPLLGQAADVANGDAQPLFG